MVRRIAGTICLAGSLMMILWLASGTTASGFVKFALLGIVGSILVLYKWDELAARMPSLRSVPDIEEPSDGVFGTELPREAFTEPLPEHKSVNLTRSASVFGQDEDSIGSSVLVATPPTVPEQSFDSSDGKSVLPDPIDSVVAEAEPELVQTPAADEPDSVSEASAADLASAELVATNASALTTAEPTFIQLAEYSNDHLVKSVRDGEASLVSVLTQNGMLSTEGKLTDTDVATMVFVAVSSDDLLRALLAGKEAEEQAAGLSYTVDTPQLYEPAPQLVEPH